MHLDAHQKPPERLRDFYKKYQKAALEGLCSDGDIVDLGRGLSKEQERHFRQIPWHGENKVREIFNAYHQLTRGSTSRGNCSDATITAYESLAVPGLLIIPKLIPLATQECLLSELFHQHLSDLRHQTNIDLHYHLARPSDGQSFFDCEAISTPSIQPKTPAIHKALSVVQLLNKKLRWMTLGHQYDWTQKVYPDEQPPAFPHALGQLLQGLFPETNAEAAIVNLYSPGDTLSLHRDVSELSDRGLISLSIGCDCLFLIGLENADVTSDADYVVLRLHSGDLVYMDGLSRFAWHSVPLIIPNTCPAQLQRWPAMKDCSTADEQQCKSWNGWLANKRINLNVRQKE